MVTKAKTIVDELHTILTNQNNALPANNKTGYPSVTIDYTPKLYNEICDSFLDYHQTGYTVCGAQDPAVIYLGQQFAVNHPELAKYTVVRVIDKFLNSWSSATLLEFSEEDITDEEYNQYQYIMLVEENQGKPQIQRFIEAIEENGDIFLSSGDQDFDLAGVKRMIEAQGYWAGAEYRYFFDEEMNLERLEKRAFGK